MRRKKQAPPSDFDVLIVGSGVAGLSVAVRLAARSHAYPHLRVGILTKGDLSQSATRWAQGGIAAALCDDEDSTDLHLADTLAAGAGLCDLDAVRVLVDEGPMRVEELISLGAEFDRETSGSFALAREGGHSKARVIHAGGAATGAEVERALVDATRKGAAGVLERFFALDLIVKNRCEGVLALGPDGVVHSIRANNVVLAPGGVGQLFSVTTNPREATGDGIGMAIRAGVAVADVEFVQFHPTALHHPAMPRPLLSEALRGHGALLRDSSGQQFVDELAPRDVVSRSMAERMAAEGSEHLWLDATHLEHFSQSFPTIAASLAAIGLDPSSQWIPIAPAAHHLSGGILTDLYGATELQGLFAVGEAACTGAHGANRLASNSLLEGMVFGARVAETLQQGIEEKHPSSGALGALLTDQSAKTSGIKCDVLVDAKNSVGQVFCLGGTDRFENKGSLKDRQMVAKSRQDLQAAMTKGAGVMRSAESLAEARRALRDAQDVAYTSDLAITPELGELANLTTVAQVLLASGLAREETRGAHARSDFSATDPAWQRRLIHRGLQVPVEVTR